MGKNGLLNSELLEKMECYFISQLIAQVENHEGCNVELLDFQTSLQKIESIEKDLYLNIIELKEMSATH